MLLLSCCCSFCYYYCYQTAVAASVVVAAAAVEAVEAVAVVAVVEAAAVVSVVEAADVATCVATVVVKLLPLKAYIDEAVSKNSKLIVCSSLNATKFSAAFYTINKLERLLTSHNTSVVKTT